MYIYTHVHICSSVSLNWSSTYTNINTCVTNRDGLEYLNINTAPLEYSSILSTSSKLCTSSPCLDLPCHVFFFAILVEHTVTVVPSGPVPRD